VARLAQGTAPRWCSDSFGGRAKRITNRVAVRLPKAAPVIELDVNEPADLAALPERAGGTLDGVLHAVAFAPEAALGGRFLETQWEDVAVALQTSAFSLKALTVAARPLMHDRGGSVVALDFDNRSQAWPMYDWMGVAKSALESTARYPRPRLGPEGIRVNLVCAGPLRTMAARGVPASDPSRTSGGAGPAGLGPADAEPAAGPAGADV